MRHQHLEIGRIQALVAEHRRVETTDAALKALSAAVEAKIYPRFSAGRKLTKEAIVGLLENCDAAIRAAFDPIAERSVHLPPTKARPKSDIWSRSYVGVKRMETRVAGYDTLYQPFVFRVVASRKTVSVTVRNLQVAFQYHAAERLLERSRTADHAFRAIAADLADWSRFLMLAERVSIRECAGDFGIPSAEGSGMYLGEFHKTSAPYGKTVFFDSRGRDEWKISYEQGDPRLYVVRTFVDRFHLRPTQLYAMNRISAWRELYATEFGEANDEVLFGRGLSNSDCRTKFEGDCRIELDAIMADPVILRAMHPDLAMCRIRPEDFALPLGRWGERTGNDPLARLS